MKCPKYVEVNGKQYKINTDFRAAIKCNEIAMDETIGNYERALAVIFTLFGEEGLNNSQDHEMLLKMAKKYLLCGKDELEEINGEPDMDYVEDMDYIEASFMSDYGIDLTNTEMDWWKFTKLINGLSNSEFGNCCVLNRIRNLRNFDLKDIKDPKEKDKIKKAKQQVALKRTKHKVEATSQQQENAMKLYEALGFKIEGE